MINIIRLGAERDRSSIDEQVFERILVAAKQQLDREIYDILKLAKMPGFDQEHDKVLATLEDAQKAAKAAHASVCLRGWMNALQENEIIWRCGRCGKPAPRKPGTPPPTRGDGWVCGFCSEQ